MASADSSTLYLCIFFSCAVRCSWNVIVEKLGRPAWRHAKHEWPHPLMILLSCFMAVRFAYLD